MARIIYVLLCSLLFIHFEILELISSLLVSALNSKDKK
jgi:hypothetical protein